jgi:RNA polymerase sigma factor (sigma-70 family)
MQPFLLRVALRIVQDPVAAEDVFMVAITRLLDRLDDFDHPIAFLSYGRRTARNAAVDLLRTRGERDARRALRDTRFIEARRPPGATPLLDTLPAGGRGPENRVVTGLRDQRIRQAVDRLGEPRRTAVRRYYFEGWTLVAIGEEIDLSAAAVKRLLGGARLTLASRLKGLEVEP